MGTPLDLEGDRVMCFTIEPWGVYLDYLKVFETPTLDYDSSGIDQGSLFPNRTNFTNALSFKVVGTGSVTGKKTMASLKWLRDFDQLGSVYSFEGVLYPTKSWAVSMGVDVLGPDNTSDGNSDARFINQFRANDRVYGGVSYVF
jgi:hypothetical protein